MARVSTIIERSTRRRTTRRDACKKSRLPELPQITTVIFLAATLASRVDVRVNLRGFLYFSHSFSRRDTAPSHRERLIASYAAICITTIIISNSRIYISLRNCGSSTNATRIVFLFLFPIEFYFRSSIHLLLFLRRRTAEKARGLKRRIDL